MDEDELAVDVAHIVFVVVRGSEDRLLGRSHFDLGFPPDFGDGTPFGIKLILRDEDVGAT